MRNSDRSTIRYEVLRGEWLLFRKKVIPTKRGWRVGSESTDFDFLHNTSCQSVLSLLYNPRPPMRGFASLKGNTLPVKNVINGLDHARIFICTWLCIADVVIFYLICALCQNTSIIHNMVWQSSALKNYLQDRSVTFQFSSIYCSGPKSLVIAPR